MDYHKLYSNNIEDAVLKFFNTAIASTSPSLSEKLLEDKKDAPCY